ncbi:NUDIX domain-containing protein [Shouchella sp. 1P09AA]|uniref:NUDIX domain-containing protein n=1 Tax=unclassified Shouchella TaxID=2893065 RepID=UPI0039A2AABB
MFIVNVEGAVWSEGKWLVIERSIKEDHAGGLLSFVGGKVESPGVDKDVLEKTVQREFLEEVGLKLKAKMTYVCNTSFLYYDTHVIDIVYLCEMEEGSKPSIISPDEVAAIYWLKYEEMKLRSNAPEYLLEAVRMAEKVRVRKLE